MHGAITDVTGIKVGHWTEREALTGCTVVLSEGNAVAGVDVRGSAPGTRETDLLAPTNLVEQAQAVVLSGGSPFGLDAASGVVRYLEEKGIGYQAPGAIVPIVPAAILFDLHFGNQRIRPNAASGYAACLAASDGPVAEGSVGAGTGATVGKIFGLEQCMKGGVGTSSARIGQELVVGALVAVNAFGDVVNPTTGQLVAGARKADRHGFAETMLVIESGGLTQPLAAMNTTLAVVATNARLTRPQATKVAQMAHDGVAMAIRPAHTMFDGDVVFALATGRAEDPISDFAAVTAIGAMAAQLVAKAILRAVTLAESLGGIPSAKDW